MSSNILYISADNENNKITINYLKKKFDLNVIHYQSDLEKHLMDHQYDAVILDYDHHENRAIELCKKIKLLNPEIASVLLTSIDYKSIAKSLINHGIDEYIIKRNNNNKKEIAFHLFTFLEKKELEHRYKVLIKAIPDTMMTVNSSGIIKEYKEGIEPFIIDTQNQSPINMHLSDLPLTQEITNICRSKIKKVLQTNQVQIFNIEFHKSHYEFRIIKLNKAEALIIIRDITVSQKSEAKIKEYMKALESSNKELDDFAYIASHDLKEPLRGITNYSQLLKSKYHLKVDEKGNMYLESLIRLSNRMKNLIESLLHYSRLGKQKLSLEKCCSKIIVEEAIESLLYLIKKGDVQIIVSDSLPEIICDNYQMHEVFTNLITNAIKYNDQPLKKIEIGYEASQKHPTFYIKDNGIGIKNDHQNTVFKIFCRLHSRNDYGGGIGAGLTIVKKIIERHQGKIWFDSVENEGTTFYFTLGLKDI
ncbi:MAG: ATP-binding protein [Spirochaetes bacterium]|nr:ATP-binding protein [Spirochaetota bacterium]